MADYLMERGVEEDQLLLEERSHNTDQNLRYSRELLEAEGCDLSQGVVVVSIGFLLPRARMLAERAGYDISTISRVSNSKYVQTNFGIYPLKYFFSESMQTDSGEEISTREVKKIMKEHIDGEDKRKPLTDEELASILKEKGYIIARRTVAKYREQLGIPVARLRKEI